MCNKATLTHLHEGGLVLLFGFEAPRRVPISFLFFPTPSRQVTGEASLRLFSYLFIYLFFFPVCLSDRYPGKAHLNPRCSGYTHCPLCSNSPVKINSPDSAVKIPAPRYSYISGYDFFLIIIRIN